MTDSPTRKTKSKTKLNWKKIFTSLGIVMIVLCLAGGSFFAWTIYKETEDFSAKKLLSEEPSKIYDDKGELMYTYGSDVNGKRENITYEDLPQVLIDAVVAAEDSRFFEHDGFDLPRIAKTLITNLAHLSIRGGGSTITQQVIKKSYFPKEEQTYTRKISEIFLAIQATKEVSKEEILTLYLNKIYFGRSTNSIGIAAASKYYFNKEVSQLTLPEAALLAGTLNSPSAYDPYYNLDLATKRRDIILNLMVDHGYITQEECDPTETQMEIYTYCNQELQKRATAMANGETYKYSDEDMQMGGSVQSTQDGRIVAVIGGHNYKSGDLNKATVKQQPGSSIKPILDYGMAYKYLDWCTGHTVKDEPIEAGIKNWDNQFHGSMTISEALENSWNIPAYTTFQEVKKVAGSKNLTEDLESLGIDMSDQDPDLPDSYAIGGWSTGVSPVEMAGAYATVANNGKYIESHTVNYIEVAKDNETIKVDEQLQKKATNSIGEDVSFMIRETMLSYTSNGSGSYAYLNGIDNIGAKTGTSNWDSKSSYVKAGKSRDLWMTGYTPDYTCSVWMGFDTEGIKKGKNTSDYKAYPGRVVGELLEYLEDTTADKKSYPKQPDNVEKIEIVAGVYPYVSPNSNTPSDKIITAWAKNGTGPASSSNSSSEEEYDINSLSSFNASLSSNGKIHVEFSQYEPANAATDENANEATKLYGVIEYVVEVTNPNTNEVLYSTTLNAPTGTINYTPSNRVNVTGYYRFQKAHEKVSNKITKSVGTDKLDDTIDYSITSNGSSVSNGSTITNNLITIKVNAQNSSNTISIDFYTSDGNAYGDSIVFTGSSSREIELTPGQYTVRISESNDSRTITDTITFTIESSNN